MTGRAPIVKYGEAEIGAPEVDIRRPWRGESDRLVRVHWHAERGHQGADAVIRVFRDADGNPVIEILAHAGEVRLDAAREARAQAIVARRETQRRDADVVCATCTKDRGHVVSHAPPMCAAPAAAATVDDVGHLDREFWATWDDERR